MHRETLPRHEIVTALRSVVMRSRPPVIFVALTLVLAATCSPDTPGSALVDASSVPAVSTAQMHPATAEPPRPAPATEDAAAAGPRLPSALDVQHATPAARVAVTVQVAPDPFVPVVDPAWPCSQWLDLALDVGWPVEQLRMVGYVMHRESRCNPAATGSLVCSNGRCARAQGLMQLLGWSCPPNGCYDPVSHLAKALDVWRSSGWRPWCLDGDRVTGSC